MKLSKCSCLLKLEQLSLSIIFFLSRLKKTQVDRVLKNLPKSVTKISKSQMSIFSECFGRLASLTKGKQRPCIGRPCIGRVQCQLVKKGTGSCMHVYAGGGTGLLILDDYIIY